MTCPKCGFATPPESDSCLRCGVIFAKLHRVEEPPATAERPSTPDPPAQADSPWDALLFGSVEPYAPLKAGARALLLVAAALWGGSLVLAGVAGNAAGESLLHLVNLPFHEFGHLLFRPFGSFMTSLGGTLGQLLIPAICLVALLFKTRDPFGASLCLWWLGENFLDIAPYINDARAGVMPLLGGNTGESSPYGFHDWEYLLTETGLLRYDHLLAKLAHGLGAVVMLTALLWGAAVILRQYRRRAQDRAA